MTNSGQFGRISDHSFYRTTVRVDFGRVFIGFDFNCHFLTRLYIRHFSNMTKSRIFKNLDLREKADRNFHRTFLKNRFRHLKLYTNPPS